MEPADAAARVERFQGSDLTNRLSELEYLLHGAGKHELAEVCSKHEIEPDLLSAGATVKRIAGQINVVIHAVGILTALPRLLVDGERIEYLSLGAGNTGRSFDLRTNKRIAEFKFIRWLGGAEAIRQNSLFKDFFYLAEEPGEFDRELYVLDVAHPLRFLHNNRSLESVMSKNAALASEFKQKYGSRYKVVSEYFRDNESRVRLLDVIKLSPELAVLRDFDL